MNKILVTLSLGATMALAHTPLMSCFDNMDGTITCEAGFSDGSSASGVEFRVEQNNQVLLTERFDNFSEVTFDQPDGEYTAIMDAGEGHRLRMSSEDIF